MTIIIHFSITFNYHNLYISLGNRMDQQRESPTEAVNNTGKSDNSLSQDEDAHLLTDRPSSSSDNDISAATTTRSNNIRAEEVEMDTITTSPSSMPREGVILI